jgi:hypothetical protein
MKTMATSARSKRSSANVKRTAFAPAVLGRARAIAPRYSYLVRFESEDEGFAARPIELPGREKGVGS